MEVQDENRIEEIVEAEEEIRTEEIVEAEEEIRTEAIVGAEEEIRTEEIVGEEEEERTEAVVKDETDNSLSGYLLNDLTIVYTLAHFLKEVFLGLWISYASLFMVNVLHIEVFTTAVLMAAGQCANLLGVRIARRTNGSAIHSLDFGFLCVVCSIPVLIPNYFESAKNDIRQILICGGVILIFQLGCGLMQTSHTLFIPQFIKKNMHRQNLAATRYVVQINSKLFGYLLLSAIFYFGYTGEKHKILPTNRQIFQIIVVTIWLAGFFSYFFFRRLTTLYGKEDRIILELEPSDNDTPAVHLDNPGPTENKTKQILVASLYSILKIHLTITLMYFPQWMVERDTLDRSIYMMKSKRLNINLLVNAPVILCTCSIIGTVIAMQYRKNIIIILRSLGIIFCLAASIYINWIPPIHGNNHIYVIAILTGFGSSLALVSAGFMASSIIHRYRNQIGHQILTYADTLVVAVLMLIVGYGKCLNFYECSNYYQTVLFCVCLPTTVLSLLLSIFIYIN